MTDRVLICDSKSTIGDLEAQRAVLTEYGVSVESAVTTSERVLIDELDGVAGLIVDAGVPVTQRVLTQATALRVVGRAGIGVDNVDLEAAREEGVTVVHNPNYCIDEVATHALSLLLACVRRIPQYDRQTSAGHWDWTDGAPIRRLQGSTIGFLAFGMIPRRLATMLQGFGCELIAYDPYCSENDIRAHNVEPVGFEELISSVDILSLHAPLSDETRGIIDAEAFTNMADGTILVNTARGPIVDTDALLDALERGTVDAAGLDVTDPEPLPADHPLHERADTIITPHAAWYSVESRDQLGREIAADVGRVLDGQRPNHEITAETSWG